MAVRRRLPASLDKTPDGVSDRMPERMGGRMLDGRGQRLPTFEKTSGCLHSSAHLLRAAGCWTAQALLKPGWE